MNGGADPSGSDPMVTTPSGAKDKTPAPMVAVDPTEVSSGTGFMGCPNSPQGPCEGPYGTAGQGGAGGTPNVLADAGPAFEQLDAFDTFGSQDAPSGIARESGGPPPPTLASCGSGVRDSSWIAFDSDRTNSNRDVYVMHPDRSALTRLTTEPGMDKEPAFDPKGGRISFTSDRNGQPQIFLMDLETKAVTALTNHANGADQSAFSRDGTLVAFHSGASVYVIGSDGQGEKLVATGLDDFNAYFSPDFSANGSELVFDRNNEIDAVHLDGTAFRMIVQNVTTIMKAPAVSPSGNDVAYHVQCGIAPSIWVTPFAAKNYPCTGKRVTPEGEADSERPAWGSDDLIAYERINPATNAASLAIISRTAGTPCSLTPDDGADNRNPAWSP